EFETGPVPEMYTTAVSQAGEERNPENLVAKESVQFGEVSESRDNPEWSEGESCETCAEYIPDKNGDGFGACAKVEGYIGSEDWCVLWESLESEQQGS
ncbi:MAG: hypothetical protein SXQ77_13100, partial [Halobacteria archaeon]|nr:hypothetical protein [Halobacteria archaeon]